LFETIPDFHNTPKRFGDFISAVEADVCGRAAEVKSEIEFIKQRKDFCSVLYKANEEGRLPFRVTHNDTKINNVMLDSKTRKALCVIDLDTIMPGFSVTDFGDSIRFGASTAAEDEKNLDKVWIDLELFQSYAKGFLEGCGGLLGPEEILLMPEGAKMMTLECGMRFLTDYLSGDTYFKTAYEGHNLDRCRTQLKLVADMEKHWDEMKEIVKKYI
ncbi:MAG: phosphotransferase, partial [Clostridia bacterium]|nr:phosphotransferase [Clostridia bacterium]